MAPPNPTRSPDREPLLTISARFELECMRMRMNVGEPSPVLIGPDGRFELRRLLGRGGMGDVFLAYDTVLERDVALKVIASRHRQSPGFRRRLLREAQALAGVRHPNVLEVHDVDTSDAGELFLTMAYIPGQPLETWQSARAWRDVVSMYVSAGRGLAAAHEHRIVHRDFKPGNVLIDEQRMHAFVADFGLASTLLRDDTHAENDDGTGSTDDRTSEPGSLAGTPSYMAPELFLGKQASFASDQYSYCVALWEALSGELPFRGRRPRGAPVPPRPPSMPAWLYRALRRGLSEDPSGRFESMTSLLSAITRGMQLRGRVMLVMSSLLTVALVAILSSSAVEQAQPDCTSAAAGIDVVWDKTARYRVERALSGEDSAGVHVTDYALAVLDDSAARWRRASTWSCEQHLEAPLSRSAISQRSCYEQRLLEFTRIIATIEGSGADGARYVHELLEPIMWPEERCRLPRPTLDPSAQTLLDEAWEAEILRDYDGALVPLDALNERTEIGERCIAGRDYTVERGEASFRRGHVHGMRESPGEAMAALDEAAGSALACGDDELLARVQVLQAQVQALDLEQPEPAERAISYAVALLDGLGGMGTQAQELHKARAFVAVARGRWLEAAGWYQAAIDALGEGVGVMPSKAKLYGNIGAALQEQGDVDGAERAYERAVELVSEALGPDHPESRARRAQAAFNIGLMALERGEHARARTWLDELSRVGEPALVVKAQLALVVALAQEPTQHDESVSEARRLDGMLTDGHYLPPRTRAEGLTVAGQVLADARDPRGLSLLEQALELWLLLPNSAFNRNVCQLDYAWALANAERLDEAQRNLEDLDSRLDDETDEQVEQRAATLREHLVQHRVTHGD